MSDTYVVERSALVNAPAERIYSEIVDLRRWTGWSPWEGLDPDLQRTYGGAEQGVGATYAWSGNRKAGQGRMEIIEAAQPSDVKIALEFLKPFKSSSTTAFRLSLEGDATRVIWTMTGAKTFMLKVVGLFRSMDKMIGSDFEKGLAQLTSVAEGS
jgi:hypothetical protein